MAVVINDFEVVTAPPTRASSPAPAQSAEGEAEPKPEVVEAAVRHQMERMARVWAH